MDTVKSKWYLVGKTEGGLYVIKHQDTHEVRITENKAEAENLIGEF